MARTARTKDQPPRARKFSPAALALARVGVPHQLLADGIGQTRQAVSMQLAGQRRPHPALIPVIRALAGAEVAEEIAALIGGRPDA